MKRNNGGENHAGGPKETFRSRRHQRHPEAHINLRGKQQGLDTGSKQNGFAALILEKSNEEHLHTFGKWDFFPKKMSSIISAKTYRRYREDSHLCTINTCIVDSSHIVNHPPTICTQHPPHLTTLPIPLRHKLVLNSCTGLSVQRARMILQVSHVMPNSWNSICTRQQGDELLPCCYGNTSYAENTMPRSEKLWFLRFNFEKNIPVTGGREVWKWGKTTEGIRGRERKETQIQWEKSEEDGEKRGEDSLAAICSSALDNLGHFCHCISIRRAETPHLPFISFPFQHLQAICILSVLPLPFISPHATTFPEW